MKLITFKNSDLQNFNNMILKTKNKFYLIKHYKNKIRFLDITCEHRGGPLIGGKKQDEYLICPWHKNKKKKCKIKFTNIPYIINKNEILILISGFEKVIRHSFN